MTQWSVATGQWPAGNQYSVINSQLLDAQRHNKVSHHWPLATGH